MKAMIFAAGKGTRLRPYTNNTPKALITVCHKPLIEHVILRLKSYGFTDILINVHHFAQQIIDFVNQKEKFGIHIEFSDESHQLLDTGGGIKKGASFFNNDAPFLIHNVDILSDLDLFQFYQSHIAQKDIAASLSVSQRETSRYLLFNQKNELKGWINKNSGETKSPLSNFHAQDYTPYAFGGIHIFSPSLFPYMQSWPDCFSIIDFYLSLVDKVNIKAVPQSNKIWMDVGKIETLQEAEKIFSQTD